MRILGPPNGKRSTLKMIGFSDDSAGPVMTKGHLSGSGSGLSSIHFLFGSSGGPPNLGREITI